MIDSSFLKKFSPFFLFFGGFFLYLYSSPPHLAAYRDAGEMASVVGTWGVAHPPGYPLYTLLAQMSRFFAFGHEIYRLNLFSGLCGAMSIVFFFLILRQWISPLSAFFAALALSLSQPFWELAIVSEMYSLGILWFSMILFVFFIHKNEQLLFFLLGLGLGVRMDFLLLVPLFLFAVWKRDRKIPFFSVTLSFFLGCSIFLSLTIRSLQDPLIDWANPDSLLGTFWSATRKNYSGTLDLLSLSYKRGENFLSTLSFFAQHFSKHLVFTSVPLLVIGGISLWKRDRKIFLFLGGIFLVMGPLFLFLANMPPNPHSLAIIEASLLFPMFILFFFIAFGVDSLSRFRIPRIFTITFAMILCGALVMGFERGSKRHSFYARDYVGNVFKSIPLGAIGIFHDDVQLFSLWAAQLCDGKRTDVSLISTGLSGSPWYWEMKKRWPVPPTPDISLKDTSGWAELIRSGMNRPVFAGYDIDFRGGSIARLRPHGLVFGLSQGDDSQDINSDDILSRLCVYRGSFVYEKTPDFFSSDLVSDYAQAHHQHGFKWMMENNSRADWFFHRAISLDPTWPRPWADWGYLFFQKGQFEPSETAYRSAMQLYQEQLRLGHKYKTLPETMNALKLDLAACYTQLGVVQEKQNKIDKAREYYLNSIYLVPNAQAHYNMAVTFWGKDWAQAAKHFAAAAQLNPQMAEARGYYIEAEKRIRENARSN